MARVEKRPKKVDHLVKFSDHSEAQVSLDRQLSQYTLTFSGNETYPRGKFFGFKSLDDDLTFALEECFSLAGLDGWEGIEYQRLPEDHCDFK